MKRTAKRTTANEIASHPVFPKEILDLISKCVWEQSTTLGSFLNWHSTCKYYWNQYLNLDEEKLLSFAEEKRRKNEELLKKHFRVEYRDNILEFYNFALILQICMTIKQKIISLVETKFFDTSNPDPKTEIYNMPQWDKWKGIKFDDGVLAKHSKEILRAVTPRIVFRFGWQLIFSSVEIEDILPEKKNSTLLFFPWNGNLSVKPKSQCYIGDCSGLAMDHLLKYRFSKC